MQEVCDFSKIATTRKQSFMQCEAAVADLRDRLKQSQQLTDACGCTDGSAAVKLCSLRDQLEAARCLQLALSVSVLSFHESGLDHWKVLL